MSSTRTLVTLLRPWIRRFTMIISAWWLRTSSKFTWEEVKTSTGKLRKWSTPKRVRIRPKYSAPSLSRDRRIKMHQSINQSIIAEMETKQFSITTGNKRLELKWNGNNFILTQETNDQNDIEYYVGFT